jgi:hypothetical protein
VLSLEKLGQDSRSTRCAVYALVVDGGSEALDCLYGLPRPQFDKMQVLIDRLATEGYISNKQKLRRLDSGVYELKLWAPPVRMFCFQDGPNWVCTHGDRKPGKRELKAQIAKVKSLRQRYLEGRQRG